MNHLYEQLKELPEGADATPLLQQIVDQGLPIPFFKDRVLRMGRPLELTQVSPEKSQTDYCAFKPPSLSL
jgi:hypothetical protein